jgi:hypothetical protein
MDRRKKTRHAANQWVGTVSNGSPPLTLMKSIGEEEVEDEPTMSSSNEASSSSSSSSSDASETSFPTPNDSEVNVQYRYLEDSFSVSREHEQQQRGGGVSILADATKKKNTKAILHHLDGVYVASDDEEEEKSIASSSAEEMATPLGSKAIPEITAWTLNKKASKQSRRGMRKSGPGNRSSGTKRASALIKYAKDPTATRGSGHAATAASLGRLSGTAKDGGGAKQRASPDLEMGGTHDTGASSSHTSPDGGLVPKTASIRPKNGFVDAGGDLPGRTGIPLDGAAAAPSTYGPYLLVCS